MSSPNSSSQPQPIPPGASTPPERSASPEPPSSPDVRAAANARLASPIPSSRPTPGHPPTRPRQDSTAVSGTHTPLDGINDAFSIGPAGSALANALREPGARTGSGGQESLTPSHIPRSHNENSGDHGYGLGTENDQFDSTHIRRGSERISQDPTAPYEDFEVVSRHLAGPPITASANADASEVHGTPDEHHRTASDAADNQEEEFSSLRLQGGDITREIYRRTEAEVNARLTRNQRSKSYSEPQHQPSDEELDIENMRQPGGFRRNYLIRNAASPAPQQAGSTTGSHAQPASQPNIFTRNFFEFLSLYGHFAGEDADDDFDSSEAGSTPPGGADSDDEGSSRRRGERRPLLKRSSTLKRKRTHDSAPKKGAAGTLFILLKSFVGTGVLFLPRAFLNGGMLFSFFILLGVACLCYFCFVLLTTSRLALKGSYADMGEMTYGKVVRFCISSSLVISQVGFSAAYIVFTSENLQAFILAVSHCKTYIDIKLMILMQLIVFLPLSLYRNLNNISFVVYTADVFIVLGLIYLYYYGIATIAADGVSDIVNFNKKSWTLFLGTAIFTFEGIGLLIPIQDGMKHPEQLPRVLILVICIIAVIFVTMGSILYAAYGSKTETVIILNMPQDNKFVNGVQFIYSLAILLSTPMQIFPAITIMEKGIFTKSGKYSKFIKWRKNLFRFCVIIATSLIAWLGAGDLDKFVALVGSFACVPLVYIWPPLIHRKAVAATQRARIIDTAICVLGVVIMVYTSIMTISNWVVGTKAAPPPRYCDKQ